MEIPIPFVGWVTIDIEDKEQMLREQIQTQQQEIERLNAELMAAKEKK